MNKWYTDWQLISKAAEDGLSFNEEEFFELINRNPNKEKWVELANEFFIEYNIPYTVYDAAEGTDEMLWLIGVDNE
jgi:hypothetical protein